MRPGSHRGPSAIYMFHKGHGILMDSAEGSYGQLYDHFGGEKEVIDKILIKTRVVFITHIHGDHQLGILKVLHERDQLMSEEGEAENKIYVVTPSPMMSWMEAFAVENLKRPGLVVLVPAENLNPENTYYYECNLPPDEQYTGEERCPSKNLEEID